MLKPSLASNYRRTLSAILLLCLGLILAACSHKVPAASPTGSLPPPPRPSQPLESAPRVVEQGTVDSGARQTITHEVAPLETIWRLSRMYDVSPEAIYAANALKPGDTIHPGQKLVIPNAKALRNVIPLYPNTQWKYIVIHHTATDVGKAFSIHRSHLDRGFWNGLGYHFLIDNGTLGKGDGQIEVAPRWIKQQSGAHCNSGGMNEKGIGVALVGNFNEEDPTSNQMQSLVYLLKTLSQYYHIPAAHIIGHRDAPGASTECPGRRIPLTSVRQSLGKP
jgi:N-acetylmuramoyl-L-alanine amidase